MQKQDVSSPLEAEESSDPDWEVPPPPELGPREWAVLIVERYGFWIVCALLVLGLGYLFLKADTAVRPAVVVEQHPPGEDAATTTGMSRALFIITDPDEAAIYIDGSYVGVSPLRRVALAQGQHLISVLKPNYAQLDTFVTLDGTFAGLQLTLVTRGDEALQEARVVPGDREGTPSAQAQSVAERASPPEVAPTTPDEERLEESPTEEEGPVVEEEPNLDVGMLQVDSRPTGASVWMGGQEVGTTPLLLSEVAVGAQQLTLRLAGYEDVTTTANIAAQQRSTVNGQMTPLLGTLRILVKPWGTIYIDDELRKSESTIWYAISLPAGNHRVRIEHPSLGQWEQVITVPAAEEFSIIVDLNTPTQQ